MSHLNPVQPRNYKHFDLQPLTGVIGAKITGIDLRKTLNDDIWKEIHQAFSDHQVITFPDQELSHEQHENFAKGFGEVIKLQLLHSIEGHDNIQAIRRLPSDTGRVVGEEWHTDSTYLDLPPKAVVMRAIDIPDFGGDTVFLSTMAAYDALSPAFQKWISTLNIVHSATRIFGSAYLSQNKRYNESNVKFERPAEEGDKEIIHPLVCTDETTGRKFLYLSKTYCQRIEGFTNEESMPLLNYLYEHCARIDFTCRIQWKKGQLLVWNNRSTMHRAVPDYTGKNRLMSRVSIAGLKPA
jgi:alpha-ketoglutarate-dependent taurine dioxygenase